MSSIRSGVTIRATDDVLMASAIQRLWCKLELYKQFKGKRLFLISCQRDLLDCTIVMSEHKTVRIGHLLFDSEKELLHRHWPKMQKMAEIAIPRNSDPSITKQEAQYIIDKHMAKMIGLFQKQIDRIEATQKSILEQLPKQIPDASTASNSELRVKEMVRIEPPINFIRVVCDNDVSKDDLSIVLEKSTALKNHKIPDDDDIQIVNEITYTEPRQEAKIVEVKAEKPNNESSAYEVLQQIREQGLLSNEVKPTIETVTLPQRSGSVLDNPPDFAPPQTPTLQVSEDTDEIEKLKRALEESNMRADRLQLLLNRGSAPNPFKTHQSEGQADPEHWSLSRDAADHDVEASKTRATSSGEVHFSRPRGRQHTRSRYPQKLSPKPYHRQSSKERRRCFECGIGGHLSADCPNRGRKFCYRCNRVGSHIASECRGKRGSAMPAQGPPMAKQGRLYERRTPPKSAKWDKNSPKGAPRSTTHSNVTGATRRGAAHAAFPDPEENPQEYEEFERNQFHSRFEEREEGEWDE